MCRSKARREVEERIETRNVLYFDETGQGRKESEIHTCEPWTIAKCSL